MFAGSKVDLFKSKQCIKTMDVYKNSLGDIIICFHPSLMKQFVYDQNKMLVNERPTVITKILNTLKWHSIKHRKGLKDTDDNV